MTHQEEVDALKGAFKNMGVQVVMAYLTTVGPWVQFPVVKQIVQWIVGFVLSAAIDKTELGLFFLYIDVRSSTQGKEFAAAALRNREAQQNGTPEERAKAEADLIQYFRALVRLSN